MWIMVFTMWVPKCKLLSKQLCDLILQLKKSGLKVSYKPYSADDARSLVQNRIGSAVKAEKDLGFKYQYSLEEGLLRLIEWRDQNKEQLIDA